MVLRMWVWRAVTVSDADLLDSAGLDALMLVKTFGLGIQLFFPLAIIGCAVRMCAKEGRHVCVRTPVGYWITVVIPIHEATEYANGMMHGDTHNRTVGKFVRLTASNVEPYSHSLWSPSKSICSL